MERDGGVIMLILAWCLLPRDKQHEEGDCHTVARRLFDDMWRGAQHPCAGGNSSGAC